MYVCVHGAKPKKGERGEEKRSWCNIRLLYNLFVVSLEKENERERGGRTWKRSLGAELLSRDLTLNCLLHSHSVHRQSVSHVDRIG